MREVFDGFLCELDSCCKELVDNTTPCADCGHCIDSILYAEAEAEAMLRENPEYIDGDGNIKKIEL
jgi:hypothetical protein